MTKNMETEDKQVVRWNESDYAWVLKQMRIGLYALDYAYKARAAEEFNAIPSESLDQETLMIVDSEEYQKDLDEAFKLLSKMAEDLPQKKDVKELLLKLLADDLNLLDVYINNYKRGADYIRVCWKDKELGRGYFSDKEKLKEETEKFMQFSIDNINFEEEGLAPWVRIVLRGFKLLHRLREVVEKICIDRKLSNIRRDFEARHCLDSNHKVGRRYKLKYLLPDLPEEDEAEEQMPKNKPGKKTPESRLSQAEQVLEIMALLEARDEIGFKNGYEGIQNIKEKALGEFLSKLCGGEVSSCISQISRIRADRDAYNRKIAERKEKIIQLFDQKNS